MSNNENYNPDIDESKAKPKKVEKRRRNALGIMTAMAAVLTGVMQLEGIRDTFKNFFKPNVDASSQLTPDRLPQDPELIQQMDGVFEFIREPIGTDFQEQLDEYVSAESDRAEHMAQSVERLNVLSAELAALPSIDTLQPGSEWARVRSEMERISREAQEIINSLALLDANFSGADTRPDWLPTTAFENITFYISSLPESILRNPDQLSKIIAYSFVLDRADWENERGNLSTRVREIVTTANDRSESDNDRSESDAFIVEQILAYIRDTFGEAAFVNDLRFLRDDSADASLQSHYQIAVDRLTQAGLPSSEAEQVARVLSAVLNNIELDKKTASVVGRLGVYFGGTAGRLSVGTNSSEQLDEEELATIRAELSAKLAEAADAFDSMTMTPEEVRSALQEIYDAVNDQAIPTEIDLAMSENDSGLKILDLIQKLSLGALSILFGLLMVEVSKKGRTKVTVRQPLGDAVDQGQRLTLETSLVENDEGNWSPVPYDNLEQKRKNSM